MKASCRRHGFSLIELLMVLLIMALVAGVAAAVVWPDQRALLRTEAERLALVLGLATEQSRVSGAYIRWSGELGSYRFFRLRDDGGWLEIRDSDVLRPRTLPRGITFSGFQIE